MHEYQQVKIELEIFELAKKRVELLRNLLAVIHRDGGHHTSEVGIEQSVKDAINKVVEWLPEA